jgi:hypothetical protein
VSARGRVSAAEDPAAFARTTMWCGRPLNELTREELYEVLDWFMRQHEEQFSDRAIRERALGAVEMLARGER